MNDAVKTPWHLWVIGFITLAWNAFGGWDYYATQSGNLAYLGSAAASMGTTAEAIIAFFRALPTWFHAFWAFGVWGALLGSLLLVLRSRFAVWAFALSLLGLAVTTVYQQTIERPAWAVSQTTMIMSLVIWSIATFLLIYAFSMQRKGVLR